MQDNNLEDQTKQRLIEAFSLRRASISLSLRPEDKHRITSEFLRFIETHTRVYV